MSVLFICEFGFLCTPGYCFYYPPWNGGGFSLSLVKKQNCLYFISRFFLSTPATEKFTGSCMTTCQGFTGASQSSHIICKLKCCVLIPKWINAAFINTNCLAGSVLLLGKYSLHRINFMFISLSAAWQFKFTQYMMPSATADASEGHLKFVSSLMGNGDNVCAELWTGAYSNNLLSCKPSSIRGFDPKQESVEKAECGD